MKGKNVCVCVCLWLIDFTVVHVWMGTSTIIKRQPVTLMFIENSFKLCLTCYDLLPLSEQDKTVVLQLPKQVIALNFLPSSPHHKVSLCLLFVTYHCGLQINMSTPYSFCSEVCPSFQNLTKVIKSCTTNSHAGVKNGRFCQGNSEEQSNYFKVTKWSNIKSTKQTHMYMCCSQDFCLYNRDPSHLTI